MMGYITNGFNGNWDSMPAYMQQMMQRYYEGSAPFLGLNGLMNFLTQVLFIALMVAAVRYLWNKGGK